MAPPHSIPLKTASVYMNTSVKSSKKWVLIVVAIALLLDNMLLTTVVPIIPQFIVELRQNEEQGVDLGNTTSGIDQSLKKHMTLLNENQEVGVMFASKAIVQLIANPFIGKLTNRVGYTVPMFCGFVIMFVSTVIFAFGQSYPVLFAARALQGLGSACSSVSGMGMLADTYTDDQERGNAMGMALGGLALGVLIGPPFGAFLFELGGKTAPFLILAFLTLVDGVLQMMILRPEVTRNQGDAPSLRELLSDQYILVSAGAITVANMGIAMMEPSLPLHMMDRMDIEKWKVGAAFLPASISYLIGTNMFGSLAHKMGRWRAAQLGLMLIGTCLAMIPFAVSPSELILPMAGLGLAIGMVDSSMMPQLAAIVDTRHNGVYGGVYAIGDVAFCFGFAIGPAISGSLVKNLGFPVIVSGLGLFCFAYSPFMSFVKKIPKKCDEDQIEMKEPSSTVQYQALSTTLD